jgi:hypothetical protein
MENEIDQKSILDFLVNPLYQNNLKRQGENKQSDNSADIKFYRKRIISLCKDMLKGNFESEELKKIHMNYVNELIFYFKMKDTSDILQSEYDSTKSISIINREEEEAQLKEAQLKEAQLKEAQLKETQLKEIYTEDKLNKNLMRKKNTSTLDNYVTIVKKEKEELVNYPVKKEINLKSLSLKNKGVRSKKDK